MKLTRRTLPRRAEAGFTLVEALVAIVVLVFGLMAVTNLMLVAASSNTVANQATAAVAAGTGVMDLLKATSFATLNVTQGGTPFDATDGGLDCADPALTVAAFHCSSSLNGVGMVHTHWFITATPDARMLFITVQSQGTGVLAAARSRAEFTTFRACTNDDPVTGGCP
jgi:type II secretory pathway pseudopilin PulG